MQTGLVGNCHFVLSGATMGYELGFVKLRSCVDVKWELVIGVVAGIEIEGTCVAGF